MSTSYYAIDAESVEVEHNGALVILDFEDGERVTLKGDAARIGSMLYACSRHSFGYAAHRSGGVISVVHPGPDSQMCVSEYGEFVTLGDLRRGMAP